MAWYKSVEEFSYNSQQWQYRTLLRKDSKLKLSCYCILCHCHCFYPWASTMTRNQDCTFPDPGDVCWIWVGFGKKGLLAETCWGFLNGASWKNKALDDWFTGTWSWFFLTMSLFHFIAILILWLMVTQLSVTQLSCFFFSWTMSHSHQNHHWFGIKQANQFAQWILWLWLGKNNTATVCTLHYPLGFSRVGVIEALAKVWPIWVYEPYMFIPTH